MQYEFLGPHGTLFVMLGLVILTVILGLIQDTQWSATLWSATLWSATLWSTHAALVYTGWIIFHFLIAVSPGKIVKGTLLPNKKRLDYNINSIRALLYSIVLLAAFQSLDPLLWIARNYLQLCTAGIVFSVLLSMFLYLASFRSNTLLAVGGNSGYPIYDFWMGRELNPRFLHPLLDLKFICELRPGLIGWFVINCAFGAEQYVKLGRLTNSMIAVIVFQGYYVFDAVHFSSSSSTTKFPF
jgi:hypothetical protein